MKNGVPGWAEKAACKPHAAILRHCEGQIEDSLPDVAWIAVETAAEYTARCRKWL